MLISAKVVSCCVYNILKIYIAYMANCHTCLTILGQSSCSSHYTKELHDIVPSWGHKSRSKSCLCKKLFCVQCDQIWRKFTSIWQILTVYFLFGELLSLLWQICDIIGLIFVDANGHILKNNLIIWSHCRCVAICSIATSSNAHGIRSNSKLIRFVIGDCLFVIESLFRLRKSFYQISKQKSNWRTAAIVQWIRLCLQSRRPGFESQAQRHTSLFQFKFEW